jgi:F0F1-type ATP synthase assembly protein I
LLGAREGCVNQPPRSSLAVAVQWASRVTTVGLEFALPALLGVGLDRWWKTAPLATVVGAVLGFAVGMMHILRLAREGTGS